MRQAQISKCYRLEGTGGASVSMRGPVTSAILVILLAAASHPTRAETQSVPQSLDPATAASVVVADRAPHPSPAAAADRVCAELAGAAAENDLPLAFFTRLIWQESRFDPDAVSRAGAQGIAQFMPKTAAWVGLDDPFDPIGAVAKSAHFLRSLRSQFGNLGLAAAAYNAGPKRVEDWLAGRRRLPRETRAYVRIVTGHAADEWMAGAPSGRDFALADSVPCPQLAALFARDRLEHSQAIPAREPKPETAAAAPERPWGVQLIGNVSPVAALAAYAELQKRYKTVLGSRQPLLLRSPAGRNAAWYRVRVAAETRGDAERLCASLRAIGGSCLVQRN
jgi:Transglycosylase SLT domain/SPOR domain